MLENFSLIPPSSFKWNDSSSHAELKILEKIDSIMPKRDIIEYMPFWLKSNLVDIIILFPELITHHDKAFIANGIE